MLRGAPLLGFNFLTFVRFFCLWTVLHCDIYAKYIFYSTPRAVFKRKCLGVHFLFYEMQYLFYFATKIYILLRNSASRHPILIEETCQKLSFHLIIVVMTLSYLSLLDMKVFCTPYFFLFVKCTVYSSFSYCCCVDGGHVLRPFLAKNPV